MYQFHTEELNHNRTDSVYNVTLMRVRVSIVAVQSSKYCIVWVCVCSIKQPSYKVHAPYSIVVCGCIIFFDIISYRLRFSGKVYRISNECVFRFSLQLQENLILRIIQRYIIINVHMSSCLHVFMYGARYSSHILMKLEFSRQISEKFSHISFNENPSIGSRVVPCGRTDRPTDMTKF